MSKLEKDINLAQNLEIWYSFWNLPNPPKKVSSFGVPSKKPFELFIEKLKDYSFLKALESLTEDEATLFYLIQSYEREKEASYYKLSEHVSFQAKGKLEKTANCLSEKYLIYSRKTISQVRVVFHSYHVYSEITEALKAFPLLSIRDLLHAKNIEQYFKHDSSNNHLSSSQFSKNWTKLFWINQGQYPVSALESSDSNNYSTQATSDFSSESPFDSKISTKVGLQEEFARHQEEGSCKVGLLFHHRVWRVCLSPSLNLESLELFKESLPEVDSKLLFMARMYQFYYVLKGKGIFLKDIQKGSQSLRKQSYSLLLSLFHGDEGFLNRFLATLEELCFLRIQDHRYETTQNFFQFLKSSMEKKYEILLSKDLVIKRIFHLFLSFWSESKEMFPLSLFSFLRLHFNQNIKEGRYVPLNILTHPDWREENLRDKFQTLIDWGLLKSQQKGYSLTEIGKFIGKIAKADRIEKNPFLCYTKNLHVHSDYTLFLDPREVSEFSYFLIELFAQRENSETLFCYRLTKNSIQRAVFLGLSIESFLECLRKSSIEDLPEHIDYNLWNWAKQTRKVFIRTVQILEGNAETIEILKHHKVFRALPGIKLSGNPEYLLYDEREKDDYSSLPNVLEEESIFFLKKDEDLSL